MRNFPPLVVNSMVLPAFPGLLVSLAPDTDAMNKTGKITLEHRRLTRYATLELDEVATLPVRELVANSAHLYLWVPNALLPSGSRSWQQPGSRIANSNTLK